MIREVMVTRVTQRAVRSMVLVVLIMVLLTQGVAAHSGEGISIDHVLIEIGTWALAVTAVIGIIVGVFWVRARSSRP